MKAAIVAARGSLPVYADFQDPRPAPGKSVIRVTAASISHITRGRATGTHYSADATFPFVPGIDGTGVDEQGRRVYFVLPEEPFGSMAERVLVDARRLIELPDGLRDETAAAMAIPGMSSWAALTERARLSPGQTVLINGATGSSGRLAIQIAKHLGAHRVIATARQSRLFEDLKRIGADVTIALNTERDVLERALENEFEREVHVVLDYLWGASAESIIAAAAKASPDNMPVRFVQIGAMSGADITLPSAALRSTALELMGSGIGSVPFARLLAAVERVFSAALPAGLEMTTAVSPLHDVAAVWDLARTDARAVLVP